MTTQAFQAVKPNQACACRAHRCAQLGDKVVVGQTIMTHKIQVVK